MIDFIKAKKIALQDLGSIGAAKETNDAFIFFAKKKKADMNLVINKETGEKTGYSAYLIRNIGKKIHKIDPETGE